jgi:hypothetical protein
MALDLNRINLLELRKSDRVRLAADLREAPESDFSHSIGENRKHALIFRERSSGERRADLSIGTHVAGGQFRMSRDKAHDDSFPIH